MNSKKYQNSVAVNEETVEKIPITCFGQTSAAQALHSPENNLHDSLQAWYDSYTGCSMTCENTLPAVHQLVERVRQEVRDGVGGSTTDNDPVLCPTCFSILYEPITFPCGHTYCGSCSQRELCRTCLESYPRNSQKRNILIGSLVTKFWSVECQAVALRTAGNEQSKQRCYDQAITLYDQALQLYPGDHISYSNRAHALVGAGRPQQALADADAAIAARPLWSKGYARRSSALIALGRDVEACSALLVCTALCEESLCAQYTSDLAKLLYWVLRKKSSREPCPAYSPFSAEDSYIKSVDTAPHSARRKQGVCHFKKLWKDKAKDEQTNSRHSMDTVEGTKHLQQQLLPQLLDCFSQSMKLTRENRSPLTPLPPVGELQPQEVECSLCYRLLWQPVNTPCGHTFCRTCLDRSLDHQPFCPLCKSCLKKFLADRRFLVCNFLDAIIRSVFPDEYNDRKEQIQVELDMLSEAGWDSNHPIPIFVATVAMPLMNCPLHVFEPRYKLMIRRCMESGTREFGMCGPSESGDDYYEYGTTLEIRDIRYMPDGRSILNTVGKRRFKVLQKSDKDGYNIATVHFIEDCPVENLEETQKLHDQVRRNVEKWFERMPGEARFQIVKSCGDMPPVEQSYWTKPQGPDWMWWFFNVLPLHHLTKQSLLGMVDLQQRLLVLHSNLLRFLKDTWTMGVPRRS